MGLTSTSTGAGAADTALVLRRERPDDRIVALAGNPNVGKSTVFNALTGLRQHTGNWPGKTVTSAQGRCERGGRGYVLVDLPGTYSLMAHSAEEEVARDFLCFGGADGAVVVCDATCLERNLNLVLQPLDLMIHQREYGVSHYLRQMDNFTIFASSKRKLRKLIRDIQAWLADVGLKLKDNWQVFRIGFTPRVEKAREQLPEAKQRRRRPRIPSALGYRFGHGYTILRKHNLFRLKQSLHLYYYRRDRNRVISFKRASGLISRLGQLRKCDCQRILERYYQPKTMFDLKKVVRKECRRLQKLYPPYQAA